MSNSFHYDENITHSFYLAGSEKDMMKRISDILRKQGYLGVAEPNGRTQFFLEADSNPYRVLKRIRDAQLAYPSDSQSFVHEDTQLIQAILKSQGFKRHLTGTDLLVQVLTMITRDQRIHRNSNTDIYHELQRITGRSPSQIERNIRYAISQSSMSGSVTAVLFDLTQLFWRAKERQHMLRMEEAGE